MEAYELFQQGKFDEALSACLALDEETVGAGNVFHLRGLIAEKQGDLDTAASYFQTAISRNESELAFHLSLARVANARGQYDIAAKHYRVGLDLMTHDTPARLTVLANLATVLERQHDLVGARDCYHVALHLKLDSAMLLKRVFVLPAVYQSAEEIIEVRTKFEQELDELLDRPLAQLRHPEHEIGKTPWFYLAYHGLNDKSLMQKVARLFRSIYPTRVEAARAPRVRNRKIKIGFVSTFFFSHSVGRTMFGLIHDLPRDRFEVEVFSITPQIDQLEKAFQNGCDRYTCLPNDLGKIRATIEDATLDILLFTDIGMHPTTYFLAFWRLAPIQIATWGHPDTSGIDTVDYFISPASMEVPQGDEHYSETLVRTHGFFLPRYGRVSLHGPRRARSELGLPPCSPLYLFPQNLFKLHPEFDFALRGILERDCEGRIILIETDTYLARLIRGRLQRTLGTLYSRLHFVPRTDYKSFLHLIANADVVLDPFHFTGCNVPSEALALGLPVVTLPFSFARSRFTLALYRELGIQECIAQSPEDFVETAVRLGCDYDNRRAISEKIYDRSAVLFDRPDAGQALAQELEAIGTAML